MFPVNTHIKSIRDFCMQHYESGLSPPNLYDMIYDVNTIKEDLPDSLVRVGVLARLCWMLLLHKNTHLNICKVLMHNTQKK